MHYYSITYNDKNSWEMRIPVKWRPSIPAPELEQDLVEIPGRDGAMTSRIKRYLPIVIPIEMNFMESEDRWAEAYRRAKRWLRGSGRLEQSDDDEWFFKVLKVQIIDSERTSKKIGGFTAEFTCDPYQYRKDGARAYNIGSVINNLYDECHPIYVITGTGTATLTVNGHTMSIGVSGKAYIDTDLQIAYDNTDQLINTSAVGDYEELYLQEGANTITISEGFSLKVIPNWRQR